MDLFPTLLEEYDLTGAPGLEYFKKHIKEKGKSVGHSLAVNGVSSHGGWDPLQDEGCKEICDAFQDCINDYNNKIGNYPSVISGAWYNILPKGGYTGRHRHESSVISGAFYVELPEGDFGQFFVVSPLQPYMMCIHNIHPTPYGIYEIDIPIKQNHLYLFPSWLEHGSRVNNTDGERITVSFNTTPAPKDMLPPEFVKAVWGEGHWFNEDS
ncbi:MAG: hypothetical protein CMO59_14805 [Verrucomicrobiales bacterium]|nr:hypothetical protein [Verrucomicrobiales bacterium]|tara:strand:+ start:6552 stop:7184 length:633 start_codon:yes stop_codon:yes gene_type:complete